MRNPADAGGTDRSAPGSGGWVRAARVSSTPRDDRLVTMGSAGAVFRPLKASEAVARDIVTDILEKGYRTGDALPNEASMIEQYGVSRESLREGLRLLETQGLITIRRGPRGGPKVGSVDPASIGRMTTLYFRMAGASYAELLEAWEVAETMLAERAARHPDAGLRRDLMAPYLGDHPPYDSEGVDDFVEMHAGFHARLATLAANRVLELTLPSYGLIVSHHVARVDDPRRLYGVLVHDHHAIARAVVDGRPRKAREEMERHIGEVVAATAADLGERAGGPVEWL